MRRFYPAFPKFDAVRQELRWTHYRLLCRIEEAEKRAFYIGQSIDNNWNTRTLQRQISSLSYERVLDHIQQFLLEVGKGFAFVARQQHIVTDTSDFFIDLVFYNYYLKCFVSADLKSGDLYWVFLQS